VKPIQDEMGLSNTQMALVLMAFTLAYGLFEVPTGHWGDRSGSRRVLARIVVWWSAFTALTGACTGFASLLLVRFLFGAGEAGAYPNAARVIARWFPPGERGRTQGLLMASGLVGGTAAQVLAGYLIGAWDWRWTFVAFGAVGVAWAAALGCGPADRALPALAVPAALLGNTRVARLKDASVLTAGGGSSRPPGAPGARVTRPTPGRLASLTLNRHCAGCEFRKRCLAVTERTDDLSLLRFLSEKEVHRQRARGVTTLTQFSHTYRPGRRGKHRPGNGRKHDPPCKRWPCARRRFTSWTPRRSRRRAIAAPGHRGPGREDYHITLDDEFRPAPVAAPQGGSRPRLYRLACSGKSRA
jgi:hypothetical protein